MPEANALLYAYAPEPPKMAAIIKISCGIGDTDGFPAFDVESDVYASEKDPKWGFLITGGAEFHMPLTVFQVSPDSLADKGGFRLGDIILEINEEDATQLTLAQAHEKIDASGKKIHFLLKTMEEDLDFEPGEEKSIVMRVPKAMPPPAASIEARLLEMQRKLSEIAEIPKILSSTLATVSQTFGQLKPLHEEGEGGGGEDRQYRKYSYDEDAIDYELSDDDEDDDEPDYATNNNDDDDDDDDEEEYDDVGDVEQDELVEQLRRKRAVKKQKDITPESDYASEANYDEGNEADSKDDDEDSNEDEDVDNVDDDDSDDDKQLDGVVDGDYDYEENYAQEPQAAKKHKDDDSNDDDKEEEEDFLSTTYTWNLRNVPKLQLNDANVERVYQDAEENNSKDDHVAKEEKEDEVAVSREADDNWSKLKPQTNQTITNKLLDEELDKEEKDKFKLDKMERSWPWADREKIIYKQSTCHLVRRRPLGLVEQRIQLLAKQHLLENLQQAERPK